MLLRVFLSVPENGRVSLGLTCARLALSYVYVRMYVHTVCIHDNGVVCMHVRTVCTYSMYTCTYECMGYTCVRIPFSWFIVEEGLYVCTVRTHFSTRMKAAYMYVHACV